MKNLKLFLLSTLIIFSTIIIWSCSKDSEVKPTIDKNSELDISTLQIAFERENGIKTIANYLIEPSLQLENNEHCTNAYAQICGTQNYTVHTRTINFKECPIEVKYRQWFCEVSGIIYISFQIIDWRPLSRCNKFLKDYNDLYWGGAPGSADELINEMYKYFSNVIENTYASWLAEIYSSSCNSPLVHVGFFARDCYKTCIDWVYTDEGEFLFGSIIEKRCASSCCLRVREWCYENGQVQMNEINKTGTPCVSAVNPQPCLERIGNCSPACERL